jgi:hypothetical protein
MMNFSHQVKIQHEVFGVILNEEFVDAVQFKLFLKMIQGCIEMKNDLTFFNGQDFFLHVPHKYLVDSLIVTKVSLNTNSTLTDHLIQKSKLEAKVTK